MRVKALAASVLITFSFVTACVPQPVRIQGTAMLPNLRDGDRVFINRGFGKLKRGDVVMFTFPMDTTKSFVKRIVGLPKETVEIRAGQVFINDEPFDEPYVDAKFNQNKTNRKPVQVPGNHFFVMGDNRDNSYDSRSWGTLPQENVYGTYLTIYYKAK